MVSKDDPFVNSLFEKFASYEIFHSPLCLINIIFRTCLETHTNLQRNRFDISSKERYLEVINDMLDQIYNEEMVEAIATHFLHRCTGPVEVPPMGEGQVMFRTELTRREVPAHQVPEDDDDESAEAAQPTVYEGTNCVVCGEETTKFCTGCAGRYRLCSKECQKLDWENHPAECKFK
jgi:hypothetical protein